MGDFGTHLRNFRESCRDPISRARKLSQLKFGEKVGNELGAHGYSGAAVSDWERGKSKIHVDDRRVLMAIIKVLHEHGGIKTVEDGNQLLEAGNYRALNEEETRRIFQEAADGAHTDHAAAEPKKPEASRFLWLADMLSISQDELDLILNKAKDGPAPSWPRVLAALMRKSTVRFSFSRRTILWIWVGLLAWWMTGPSMQLPYRNGDAAFLFLTVYAAGSFIVPMLIGLLVNTKDSEYWNRQVGVNPFLLRLYTYQGAGIGFNVGYFLIFSLNLAIYYLGFPHTILLEISAAIVSVILANMAAHVVPHNLWRAYKRLMFRDGAIFFVVALMGPVWAFFFLEYYGILLRPAFGIIIILLALTTVVLLSGKISNAADNIR